MHTTHCIKLNQFFTGYKYYFMASVTTETPGGSNGRKRKAGPHGGAPTEKVARAPKKCDRKVCELISAIPFCFVRATDK